MKTGNELPLKVTAVSLHAASYRLLLSEGHQGSDGIKAAAGYRLLQSEVASGVRQHERRIRAIWQRMRQTGATKQVLRKIVSNA